MSVVADLPTLKKWLGTIGDSDDLLLQLCLDQATAWAADHLYPDRIMRDDVQGALLDQASRWYQRRRSPEGVAGFSEFGAVRISFIDPDIQEKLRFSVDLTKAGVA